MSKNENSQRYITIALLVIMILSLLFAGYKIYNRFNYANNVNAVNAKVVKRNKVVKAENKKLKENSLQYKAETVLASGFNGSLSNADDMWKYLHNQNVITGLTSMQGTDKEYYKSTYFNGVTSSVDDIYTSEQADGSFIISFTYSTTSLTGSGNTQTKQLLYVATGQKTGDNYDIMSLKHTASTNY